MTTNPLSINFGLFGVRVLRPSYLTVWIGPFRGKTYTISEGTGPMDISLGDNQFTTIHLEGLDAANQAGKFINPPRWSVDDPAVVTITPSPDGTECRVEAAVPAKLGGAVVTVTDADDPNVEPLVFAVTVGGEQVTHLGATIDPPSERTASPPTGT